MFEAAREYNDKHRETITHFDVTGYEYSLVRPSEPYTCFACGKQGLGIQGVTGYVRESYYDPAAPLGRSQRMKGSACSEECAFKESSSVRDLVQHPSPSLEGSMQQFDREGEWSGLRGWPVQRAK